MEMCMVFFSLKTLQKNKGLLVSYWTVQRFVFNVSGYIYKASSVESLSSVCPCTGTCYKNWCETCNKPSSALCPCKLVSFISNNYTGLKIKMIPLYAIPLHCYNTPYDATWVLLKLVDTYTESASNLIPIKAMCFSEHKFL